MPDDEKDKYDELEEIANVDDIESQLEELPVEAVPEPFVQPTEPMDDIQKQASAQEPEAAGGEQAHPKTQSDLGKKIEAAAKVRDASEYLKGQKQIRVIKKSAIKSIVDSIIQEYSGMEHKELLSKIAEYEFNISNLRQDREVLKNELERLRREGGSLQEQTIMNMEKELEELRIRLATAEELLSQDSSKEKIAKLEEELVYLRQRVKELEHGLEFATVVEEFDYGLAMESATQQKEKIAELGTAIDRALEAEPEKESVKALKEVLGAISDRYDYLMHLLKEAGYSYTNLFKKVGEKEGSVGVVAELVRLNARNRGWSKELNICEQLLQAAEPTVRGK